MKLRDVFLVGCALLGLGGLAVSQGGLNQGFPIVGKAAYCASSVNGVCVSTIPAGPTNFTGAETFLADTQLTQGQNPQTVAVPIGFATINSQGAFRNALIGGDFGTNLWQRGTTFTAATPTTAAYTADRFAMYSSGNTVTVTRQTGAADVPNNLVTGGNGLLASLRVNRPSATDVTDICIGQVLPAKDAARLLGNNVIFSWFALNGSTMSSVNGAVKVTIAYGTAADSATPNTNTDAWFKGTLTGYTAVTATVGTNNTANTSGTVTSAVGTIPQSTTWYRYWATGSIPTTATTVGVKICYTPVGTGASTDWFEIAGVQLEPAASGIVAPGSFSRRQLEIETALQQSFSFGLVENTSVVYAGGVLCSSTANAHIAIQYPTQMRIATPTVTVTAGGFSIKTAAATTAIGTTTLLATSAQHGTLTSGAACTSTLPYQLVGTNTTGLLLFSAEP